MIDFHTHILPCIDDGAASLEESLALLGALEAQGVGTVVLTPHYYGRKRDVEYFLEKRARAYRMLCEAYQGGIRLLQGCECNLDTCANTDVSSLRPLALEGTRYILAELSFRPQWTKGDLFFRRLKELKEEEGLTPVIAHAELYPALRHRPEWAAALIEAGCLLQINCDSVINAGKRGLVRALLSHGQVHCLGSDTHDPRKRPPRYGAAAALLKERNENIWAGIQENMRKILADLPLRFAAGEPVKKTVLGYV